MFDILLYTVILPIIKYSLLFVALYFVVRMAVLQGVKAAYKQFLLDKAEKEE